MSQTAAYPDDPRIHVDADHLLKLGPKSRAISLLPRQPARSILNGRHASRLRGRGLNFEELRNYLPGDDIRTIDWKVTARTGKPHVRVYTEERDRPALLLVDQRVSMFFGTRGLHEIGRRRRSGSNCCPSRSGARRPRWRNRLWRHRSGRAPPPTPPRCAQALPVFGWRR